MTKNEKLADRLATRAANISEREALCRTTNSRTRRTTLVRQACEDVRVAKMRIAHALKQIKEVRSASQVPDGEIYRQIDLRDARIAEINSELAHLRNAARIEKAMELFKEINFEEKRLAQLEVGNPAAVTQEDIVS